MPKPSFHQVVSNIHRCTCMHSSLWRGGNRFSQPDISGASPLHLPPGSSGLQISLSPGVADILAQQRHSGRREHLCLPVLKKL